MIAPNQIKKPAEIQLGLSAGLPRNLSMNEKPTTSNLGGGGDA